MEFSTIRHCDQPVPVTACAGYSRHWSGNSTGPPSTTGARYYSEVFGRPLLEPLHLWDDDAASGTEFWATEHETRDEVVSLYRHVWKHTDATINALAIDAPGYVPW